MKKQVLFIVFSVIAMMFGGCAHDCTVLIDNMVKIDDRTAYFCDSEKNIYEADIELRQVKK